MALTATARPGVEATVPLHADLGHLGHDTDLVNKITRKRQDELARRTKLLDPRTRQFGVDHAVLDSQVAEKRMAADAEASEEAYHAKHLHFQEDILQTVENMKQQAAREKQKAVVDFSLTHLSKEKRREYALSDPNALRNEVPPGVDEPLGPSAMQNFQGECPQFKEMKKNQQQQQREWLQQQMREKEHRKQAERDADRQYDNEVLTANTIRGMCEQTEIEERRQDKHDEVEENKQRAAMNFKLRQERAQRDANERYQYAEAVRTSDRMNEAHDYQVGLDGRLIRTEYKRMTVEEEQDVHNANARLVLDKHARKRQEAVEEAQHAHNINCGVAVLGALEAEQQRRQKEKQKQMVQHNQNLAAAKRDADIHAKRTYKSFDYYDS